MNGVSYDKPPIGSHLFKPEHALKGSSDSNIPSELDTPLNTLPSTSAQSTTTFPHFQSPQSYMPSFFPMMNPIPPFPYLFPPTQSNSPAPGMSSRGTKRPIDVRSSSPDYDFKSYETLSIEDFCARYNLDKRFVDGLTELQFTPGDNLAIVSEQEYLDAGFTTLSWRRAIRASRDFIRSNRK